MAWHAPCVSQGRESVKGVSDVQPVSSGHTDVTAGRDGRAGRSLVVVGGYGDAGLTGGVGVGAAIDEFATLLAGREKLSSASPKC